MSNDLGSVPMQTGIILLLIAIHGLFVLINTALGASGRNKEKQASANKLIILLCAVFGGWLAFTGIWELVIYFVVLVSVGQYFPRKRALQHAEAIAVRTLAFDEAVSTLLRPATLLLMFVSNLLLRVFRQKTNVEDGEFSEEEVMSMLEVGQETGVIKEEGRKMINSIFAFDDKLAYEVMTPRTDVFLIDIEDQPEEYLDDLMTLRYSRIPVCEGETDNIIGILNIKDYLIKAREDGFDAVDIKPILRKAYFVPETKNIDSLFFELQKKCDSAEISTKALDLRGLLDALDLIRSGVPAGAALDMGITNKAFDSYEQSLIRDVAAMRISPRLTRRELFED